MTNKKDLSESDIKSKFITPAPIKAGWNEQTQIRREVFFTDGRIYVKGNLTSRGKKKRTDYIEDMKILQVNPFDDFGSPVEIVKLFGGKIQYLQAIAELEHGIYKV